MNAGPAMAALAARAADLFSSSFAARPAAAFAAPGRVNLIGEHVDYNDGLVLPIAIDRWTLAIAAPAADPHLSRIRSESQAHHASLDIRSPILPDHALTWTRYAAGAAEGVRAEAAAAGWTLANLDVAIVSSLPIGAGLASSAALEVALAGVFALGNQLPVEPRRLALLCQDAEHHFAGVPCGIMDQFASVMAEEQHALLLDCRDQSIRSIPMPPTEAASVVVMNTNTTHALAAGEYAARREDCRAAAAALGVASLRDADQSMIAAAGSLTDSQRRAALHVVSEIGRTRQAAALLDRIHADASAVKACLGDLGAILRQSHASLRGDFRVSCPELDTVVEVASSVPGVLGARMTGAGFGGCALALVEPQAIPRLVSEVAAAFPAKHRRNADLFRVQAVRGAGAVPIR